MYTCRSKHTLLHGVMCLGDPRHSPTRLGTNACVRRKHQPAPDRSRGAYAGDDRLSQIMQKVFGILGQLSRALQEDELWYFFPCGEISIICNTVPEHPSDPVPGAPSKVPCNLIARWYSSMCRMMPACNCCISRIPEDVLHAARLACH